MQFLFDKIVAAMRLVLIRMLMIEYTLIYIGSETRMLVASVCQQTKMRRLTNIKLKALVCQQQTREGCISLATSGTRNIINKQHITRPEHERQEREPNAEYDTLVYAAIEPNTIRVITGQIMVVVMAARNSSLCRRCI